MYAPERPLVFRLTQGQIMTWRGTCARWTSQQKERNWFIEKLQRFAKEKVVRITIFSGDVHTASVGLLKTLSKGKGKQEIPPAADHRYMANIVSSRSTVHSTDFDRPTSSSS